jgi:hypothetical protein
MELRPRRIRKQSSFYFHALNHWYLLLQQFPFPVTKNLADALRQFCLPSSERVIWIDAIYINQDKDTERSHQVKMIRATYQKAERVAVWLGIEERNGELAFDLLHRMLKQEDAEDWVQEVLPTPDQASYLGALTLVPTGLTGDGSGLSRKSLQHEI